MATIQRYDGSSWVDIDYQDFRIENGISRVLPAPKAVIETHAQVTVNANEQVRVQIDGTTRFEGYSQSAGEYGIEGQRRLRVNGYGWDLMDERVDINQTNATDLEVLQAALDASARGGEFTLSQPETSTNIGDYVVTNRSIKRVFRDVMDRTAQVWWIDSTKTIHVESVGYRGTWTSVDTSTDAAGVISWDPGDVETVENDVTVYGTGAEQVIGSASDSTSISEYGKRSAEYNYAYITTTTQANDMASSLLVPDPLASGEVLLGETVGSVYSNLSNHELDLTDSTRDINGTHLISKQVIKEGRVELTIGEKRGSDFAVGNRRAQSVEDITEPGSKYGGDRLVDTSITEEKLADLAVATSKLQDNAVINGKLDDLSVSETKIQDDSISTPKLQAGSVTANEIEADTITASEIAAGTITALEIESDTITASEIAAGTITALEIASDTITANEIDTLSLETAQLEVGTDTDSTLIFESQTGSVGDIVNVRPSVDNGASLGGSSKYFNVVWSYYGQFASYIEGDDYHIGGSNSYIDTTLDIDIPGQIGFRIEEAGSGQRLIPDSDGYGRIGDSNDRMYGVYALNIVEGSPEPLDPTDPRSEAQTDGGPPVDLNEFTNRNWGNAPDYTKQRHQRDGTWTKEEDGNLELGHTINYVWEAAKEIERERQRLADRVDSLEQRLSALEEQV